jgi:hypothetical protein
VAAEKKSSSAAAVTFSTGQETGKSLRPVARPQVPDEPFVYREPMLQFNGPVPPTMEVIERLKVLLLMNVGTVPVAYWQRLNDGRFWL